MFKFKLIGRLEVINLFELPDVLRTREGVLVDPYDMILQERVEYRYCFIYLSFLVLENCYQGVRHSNMAKLCM